MMQLEALRIILQRLVGNEQGAEVMEYVAWAGVLIAAVVAIGLGGFGTAISTALSTILGTIPGAS
jgi:Flp pilus assembly pilin Flp